MPYPLALLAVFAFPGFVVFGVIAWRSLHAYRLRHTLQHRPFPSPWRNFLYRTSHYPRLDRAQRERIEREIMVFVHTRRFTGIDLEVSDEMRVLIAFYALLITAKNPALDYNALQGILIYARDFIVHEVREHGGIVSEANSVLGGQASDDTLVLAWNEARAEAYAHDKYNVIIHECAHLLDFENGVSEGMFEAQDAETPTVWHARMRLEYDALEKAYRYGDKHQKYALLGEYASTNEAEFFAVASERYFSVPEELKECCPTLFTLLQGFYAPDEPLEKSV